jgi:hypothetical protein
MAEIGVLHGDFSQMILSEIDPETLVLIDPYSISESKYNEALHNLATAYSTEKDYADLLLRFEDRIKEEQIIVKRDYSYNVSIDFPDKGFDCIYHDGSHVYFDLKRDLKDWLPKLKENGIMAGHDYLEHSSFGVIQAVNEFCEEYKFEMIIFNEQGGDWALKRKQ